MLWFILLSPLLASKLCKSKGAVVVCTVHTDHLGILLKYSSALVSPDETPNPAFATGFQVMQMTWGLHFA